MYIDWTGTWFLECDGTLRHVLEFDAPKFFRAISGSYSASKSKDLEGVKERRQYNGFLDILTY